MTGLKWFWKQITILAVLSISYPEPSGPPLDVVALTNSSTSILVKWNPPSELDRNGVITHYIVTYNVSLGSETNITTSENSTQKLVSNLRKYSPYNFTVRAVNNIGVGPPSVAVINTTAEDSKYKLFVKPVVPTLSIVEACNLIFRIHVVVNWQLSKQGICWSVSHDHIAGPSDDPSRLRALFKLSVYKFLVWERHF